MDLNIGDTNIELNPDYTIKDVLKEYERVNNIKYEGGLLINNLFADKDKLISDYDLDLPIKYVDFLNLPGSQFPNAPSDYVTNHGYNGNKIYVPNNLTVGEIMMRIKRFSCNIDLEFPIFSDLPLEEKYLAYETICESRQSKNSELPEILCGKYKEIDRDRIANYYYGNSDDTILNSDKFYYDTKEPAFIDLSFTELDIKAEDMKRYKILLSGSTAVKYLLKDKIKQCNRSSIDIDIFSESLDFLRYVLSEYYDQYNKIEYLAGKTLDSYKINLKSGYILNFIHTGIDSPPKDLSVAETSSIENLINYSSKTFDLSCCCVFWDGESIYYNQETKKMNCYYVDFNTSSERLTKYRSRGFETILDDKNEIFKREFRYTFGLKYEDTKTEIIETILGEDYIDIYNNRTEKEADKIMLAPYECIKVKYGKNFRAALKK